MVAWATVLQADPRGIVGQEAPSLWASRWFNTSARANELELSRYRGRVIYILFFQAWCPGCHSYGFPTLREVRVHYSDSEDVEFIAIQTVFEGSQTNDEAAARQTVEAFGLDIPVGHDPGPDGQRSETMRRYR